MTTQPVSSICGSTPDAAVSATSIAILVVEDNPGDACLVRESLQSAREASFEVTTVGRISQAAEVLRQQSFDTILLDLSLPDSSGMDSLLAIGGAAADTPIVVITGRDDLELEMELVRRGVQEYLIKDEIDPRRLGRAIRHAIERSHILLARRHAEEALRRSEANLRALIEATPEAILVHQRGLLLYANPAGLQLLGAEGRDVLLGKPILDSVLSDDHPILLEMVASAHSARQVEAPRELRLQRSDGFVVDTEVVAIEVDYGELAGGPAVLMVARDLTAQKRSEVRAKAVDRVAALGIFAAGMAHEINNPLSYVIGNLDYLADEIPAMIQELEAAKESGARPAGTADFSQRAINKWGELRETIDDAREGADRVRSLVADLKMLSPGADEPRADSDARAVLESVLRLMGGQLRSRARIVRSYAAVPQVRADTGRLSHVLLALLSNALQALLPKLLSRNQIHLSIYSELQGQVTIQVRDNGEGMSSSVMRRIFDPFFTTKGPGGGAGLGLSICQTIVSELRGEITVESTPGKGSSFCLVLPVADTASPAP